MNQVINITLVFMLFLPAIRVEGQGMPQYSQYMMDGFLINPALAGNDGYSSYNLTARQQWVGLPNAPSSFALSGQTRILKGKYKLKKDSKNKSKSHLESSGRVGLGGFLFNDRYGLINRTGAQFSYAYHIFIHDYQLSFGLSANIIQVKIITDGIVTDDPVVNYNSNRVAYTPDAGFGMCLTTQSFYYGFAIANLLQSTIIIGNQNMSNYTNLRQYYFTGGYRINLNTEYQLEPSALLKLNELLIAQADITCRVYLKDNYWGGLSYRVNPGTGGDVIVLAGVKVNRLIVGYAFDYTLNGIRKYTYGSHEITVGIKLGSSARRFPWLNRY